MKKKYNNKYVIFFIFYLINSILIIILPSVLSILIDYVLPSKNKHFLFLWGLGSLLFYLIYHIFNAYIIGYFYFKFQIKTTEKKMINYLNLILNSNNFKIKNHNSGYAFNVIFQDVDNVVCSTTQIRVEILACLAAILISLCILCISSAELMFVNIFFIPLYIVGINIFKPALEKQQRNQKEQIDILTYNTQNILNNKKSIYLNKCEAYFENQFSIKLKFWIKYRLKYWFLNFSAEEVPKFIVNFAKIVVLLFLAYQYFNSKITLGFLLFESNLSSIFLEQISRIAEILIRKNANSVSFQRLAELDTLNVKEQKFITDTNIFLKISNADVFINDTYLYHIKDIEIAHSGLYQIEGKNGTGKSTLFNILKGVIDINNLHLNSSSIVEISNDIYNAAYLSAPYIFAESSVEDNIRLLRDKTDKWEEIISMLNINFLDKIVDIKNINLSYGEQVKIALARTFLSDTRVIILDEPFVNLDNATKNNIKNYLKDLKNNKIIFLITHEDLDDLGIDKKFTITNNLLYKL